MTRFAAGRPSGTRGALKGKSLTSMMWLATILLLLLFCITFTVSTMFITERAERDYEIRESETVIGNMVGNIQANIDNYKDISRLIMLNSDVASFLRADSADVQLANNARDGIVGVLNVCLSIDSVFIFRNDGAYVSTGKSLYTVDFDRMRETEWQEKILSARGGAVIVMNGNSAIFKNNGTPMITIARAIYDIYSQQQTGILLMNITENMLTRITLAQGRGNVCVVSDDGNCLAGNALLAEKFSSDFLTESIVHNTVRTQGDRRMISGCAPEGMPLVVMCETSANTDVVPRETMYVILFLLLTFLGAVLICGTYISRNVTRPILNLTSAMEETKSSGWLKKLDVDTPENEIGMLADSYNSMIEHLNVLFNRLLENEKTVQKAEMRVLHEQIKPHFLYNSLETISFLALDAGAEEVHSALEILGSFYRNFLSKGDREIPLRREICIIQDYLSLQKLRYGDVLNDQYDIDEDTLECMIPKLILQPLVENSIYHGIRLKGEPGVISIGSRLAEDGLHIVVRDTGVGMQQELIDRVLTVDRSEETGPADPQLAGFGLKGTIDRIRYYCDSDDVVQIRSEPGEYTEIEITIPQMQKETGKGER